MFIDFPDSLGYRVGRGNHDLPIFRRFDGAFCRIPQSPGKEVVEGFPVLRRFIKVPVQLKAKIPQRLPVIGFAPGILRIEESAVFGGEPHQPASEGFMIHQGIVIIPLIRKGLQRLIADKIEAAHALVDPIIQVGIFLRWRDRPGKRQSGPVNKGVVGFQGIHRICIAVRIDCRSLSDGFLQQRLQLRTMLHRADQVPGDRLMLSGSFQVGGNPALRLRPFFLISQLRIGHVQHGFSHDFSKKSIQHSSSMICVGLFFPWLIRTG